MSNPNGNTPALDQLLSPAICSVPRPPSSISCAPSPPQGACASALRQVVAAEAHLFHSSPLLEGGSLMGLLWSSENWPASALPQAASPPCSPLPFSPPRPSGPTLPFLSTNPQLIWESPDMIFTLATSALGFYFFFFLNKVDHKS